jgi:Fic family protein
MNRDDFESSPSGSVIQGGRGNAAYWAFIPHPLPPALTADWDLSRQLSTADRSLSELAGLGRSLPNPNLFVAPFLRREAVLSSRIEGTRSSIDDLYFYEAGQMPLPGLENLAPSEADLREVLNYVTALKYGLTRLDTLPVSLRLISEVHKLLMQGVRGAHATPGVFRTRQNWIGGQGINDAVYVPPPVDAMHTALGAFEKYLHQSDDIYPPLVRLAFIHYQFEAIHPFVDGNGRIGRLLLSLLLVSWNLLPLPLLYLSAYFERNRQAYYDLLLAVSQKGDWRDWVSYFLKGVQEQAQDTVWRIKKLQDLQMEWRNRLGASRASANDFRLLDYLSETPIVTISQVQKLLQVNSYNTAKRSVERLIDMNVLFLLEGAEYDRHFVARDILLTLAEEQSPQ